MNITDLQRDRKEEHSVSAEGDKERPKGSPLPTCPPELLCSLAGGLSPLLCPAPPFQLLLGQS